MYGSCVFRWAEFLDEIQTKVLGVFLLAIHGHLHSFALRFLFLQTHATSYSFYSSVTIRCKGERRINWEKTTPPAVFRIQIHRIHMFFGLPDPDPLVRGMDLDQDPALYPDPDTSIIMQK